MLEIKYNTTTCQYVATINGGILEYSDTIQGLFERLDDSCLEIEHLLKGGE